jgi:hypothetical protein
MRKLNLRKLFLPVVLLATTLTCYADIAIEDLLVRRQGSNINIRVNVNNPSSQTQDGPIVVALLARKDASMPWTTVHVWNNISKLAPGNRVARDYFDENNTMLAELAEQGTFEVKALVRSPGDGAVESVTTFDN